MTFKPYLAYEASAGSGKTFALVIRYISLLYLGAKPSTILALTFTNKAANEMQERINHVLSELHLERRDAERKAIAQSIGITEEEIIKRRDALHLAYLKSDLKISTIDKFFGQILRKFSLHLGLMPDFQIEAERDEIVFIETFLKQCIAQDKYKDLVRFAALESKKLGSIFTFLDYLYAKDAEIAEVEFLAPEKIDEKTILHTLSLLQELFFACDALSDAARKALMTENIDELLDKSWIVRDTLEYHYFKKCYTPRADELLHELQNRLQQYLLSKERFLLSSYVSLYKLYKETKLALAKQTNELGFDDVTNAVFTLLRQNIDSEFLYFRLDAKIDHVLIDEFQDTNVIQYKILEPILDEIRSGVGTKTFKTLFYVGDVKQSIYRFRGGAKELFSHTKEAYDVTLEALTTNYRSSAKIVEFVNDTFRSQITGYKDQLFIGDKEKGFIKVETTDTLLESVIENTLWLIDQGIDANDIAILTYTNDAAFDIEEGLLRERPNLRITTQTTAKLINAPMVASVISFLKYLYFKEDLFKADFLTAIGLKWDTPIETIHFSKYKDLLSLVKQIIVEFKLFNEDASLLKFLEVIANYKDIEAFLFEADKLSIDAPSKKEDGIRIMTIHKSKGLEFEHVLLCDRFKKKNADRSSLIFSYQDIELQNIYVRMTNRAAFDPDYAQALEAEKKLAHEDLLNLLYVAFTRAKSSLVICKNDKDSSFESLSLEDGVQGNLTASEKTFTSSQSTPLTYTPIQIGRQETKSSSDEEQQSNNFEAIQFGLALHYLLESMESFDHTSLQPAFWAMQNRFGLQLSQTRLAEVQERIERLISHDPFLALVDGTHYKEQPIAYNKELKQLDLLVEKEDRWVIIDYKTSPSRQSAHVTQVHHYKKAMSEILDKPVEAYLCYIRENEIVLEII